jgi:uncharacterized RDD family membrane protein YckC
VIDSVLQQKRLIAAAIDVGVLVALWAVMSLGLAVIGCAGALAKIGFLGTYGVRLAAATMTALALVYVVARDVVAGDRSLGKRVMDIRVVTDTGAPIGILESVKRNALFAPGLTLALVSVLLAMLPIVGCFLACLLWPARVGAGLLALAAVIYEIVQITTTDDGVRLGDRLAGTRVVS